MGPVTVEVELPCVLRFAFSTTSEPAIYPTFGVSDMSNMHQRTRHETCQRWVVDSEIRIDDRGSVVCALKATDWP